MKRIIDKIILSLCARNFFWFLSDKAYLKMLYRIKIGKKLDLKEPKTFNEKLQWLKLYDRKPEYVKMVDKYEVRNYVKEKIGEEYLIPLLGVYNNFDDIKFDELPDQFVIKCTHDSGGLVICKNKNELDIKKARKKINKCLKRNYYYNGREWPYKNIKPRIIIEKYMIDAKTKVLNDYKFFIFNDKFIYSFICSDRTKLLKFTFFDKNGKFMNFTQDDCPNDPKAVKPKNYNEMIFLAERLAKGIPQVRVDFYEVNGKIYFGEMTFFDSSGFGKFEPEEWDLKIGKMLKLPKKKEEK